MHRFFCSLLAAFSLLFSNAAFAEESAPGKTIIILDASGSMWGQIEGKAKIEIAREVIRDLLGSLNPDLELGLMSYGHREKGSCEDIELLVPPGKLDRDVFLEKVMGIIPKGKTPLTAAVEQAAEFLKYEEEAANVILVSDGLETCDRDPCELAATLAAKGIKFRTHIVAFDLTAEESDSFRCLADETGGSFLQARDAATLKDALELAVDAVSSTETEKMREPAKSPATIKAPASVVAGSTFQVEWEGPDNPADYLTIVTKETPDDKYGNYAYTRKGSPLELTAPDSPGLCEVRYLLAGRGNVLGRVDIEVTPVEATVKASAEVVAGASLEVAWTGPSYKGDYITIVASGADEGTYTSFAYTSEGTPATVRAPSTPGDAEIRYVTGQNQVTLARAPIRILEGVATVSGPEAVEAGETFPVSWTGPNNERDYVTIVKKGAKDGTYNSYVYSRDHEEMKGSIIAPEESGEDYELRYVDSQSKKTLASAPIIVRAVSASVKGPATVVAGSEAMIEWVGPKYPRYYVTIVLKDEEIGKYGKFFYTEESESPAPVGAPETPGEGEIRFMTKGGSLLASAPITIVEATVRLIEVPETVAAGENFRVKWEGPDNDGDWVTIVKADAEDKAYLSYIYSKSGPDQDLTAPEEPGDYEIRYVTGGTQKVLAREAIKVLAE